MKQSTILRSRRIEVLPGASKSQGHREGSASGTTITMIEVAPIQ